MARKRIAKGKANAEQTEIKAEIKIESRPDTPFYYVNYMAVTHNAYDFTLSVAKLPTQPSPEQMVTLKSGGPLMLEATMQIVIPPRVAKGLINALSIQCEKYEKQFGTISVDGD